MSSGRKRSTPEALSPERCHCIPGLEVWASVRQLRMTITKTSGIASSGTGRPSRAAPASRGIAASPAPARRAAAGRRRRPVQPGPGTIEVNAAAWRARSGNPWPRAPRRAARRSRRPAAGDQRSGACRPARWQDQLMPGIKQHLPRHRDLRDVEVPIGERAERRLVLAGHADAPRTLRIIGRSGCRRAVTWKPCPAKAEATAGTRWGVAGHGRVDRFMPPGGSGRGQHRDGRPGQRSHHAPARYVRPRGAALVSRAPSQLTTVHHAGWPRRLAPSRVSQITP
jgi:hypothetical protein